jgi:nicotinamide-nucleotide amidase
LVDVRLSARNAQAESLVSKAEEVARGLLEESIYGMGSEELEEVVLRVLRERGETLALAESCTGGSLANRLTNIPGASAVFVGGLVTYSNEAKQTFLGVRAETLQVHGAVSAPVAREMAEGARMRSGANYALSLTGIAGPDGGTADKPVGTVFIGLAMAGGCHAVRFFNPWDRLTFKQVAGQQALDLLRRALLQKSRRSQKQKPAA